MTSTLQSLVAGLSGAVVVNALHESVRHAAGGNPSSSDVPRLDRLGEAGLVHGLHAMGLPAPRRGNPRYTAALAGDIAINTLLYALVAKLTGKPLIAGTVAALSAGATGIAIPPLLGLGQHTGKNTRVKSMTFAMYALGGIATGGVLHLLSRRSSKN